MFDCFPGPATLYLVKKTRKISGTNLFSPMTSNLMENLMFTIFKYRFPYIESEFRWIF